MKRLPDEATAKKDKSSNPSSHYGGSVGSGSDSASIQEYYKSLMMKNCATCSQSFIVCDCQTFVQEPDGISRQHDYETIEFKEEPVTIKVKKSSEHVRTPHVKASRRVTRKVINRRKTRTTPRNKCKKYGAVNKNKIKSVRKTYYKVPPNRNTNRSSQTNGSLTLNQQSNGYECISSGYSSRCSSVSSGNSSSSLNSIKSMDNLNSHAVISSRDQISVDKRENKFNFIQPGEEETFIPEQKDIPGLIKNIRSKNNKANKIPNAFNNKNKYSDNSDAHQHENNRNIEISNSGTISQYLAGLQSLYSAFQVAI